MPARDSFARRWPAHHHRRQKRVRNASKDRVCVPWTLAQPNGSGSELPPLLAGIVDWADSALAEEDKAWANRKKHVRKRAARPAAAGPSLRSVSEGQLGVDPAVASQQARSSSHGVLPVVRRAAVADDFLARLAEVESRAAPTTMPRARVEQVG